MDNKAMNEYLSDDQVNDLTRKLNTCYPDFFQWRKKKAQKVHIDMHGQQINIGDHYYCARIDNNFSSDLKLSEQSMERMLYAIFINVPDWVQQTKEKTTVKHTEIRDIIEKLRPL